MSFFQKIWGNAWYSIRYVDG